MINPKPEYINSYVFLPRKQIIEEWNKSIYNKGYLIIQPWNSPQNWKEVNKFLHVQKVAMHMPQM